MNEKYNELIDTEISRKDFLKFIGGGIVVILGINNFIQYLTQFQRPRATSVSVESTHGFGSRKFGA